jgi:SSS family solute:Na+ symporter
MISQMPADHLSVLSDKHTWLWFIAYCTQTCFLQNSIIGANKFLAVRDGKAARKAAYVAAVLFILGPIIWFIPPLAATFLFPDIGRIFGGLNSPSDGAYALMGLNLLPSGLIGLMVMVIFGATLSSMDTAINVNSGILSLNVYKPLVRPAADEREMLIAARVFNVLCGGLVTMTAYFLSTIPLNLFDLMLLTLSVLGFPMAVPCVLVYFFRKASPWAAPCTVLIGCGYSLLAAINKWGLPVQIFGTALIGTAVFTVATLFWNRNTDEVKHSIEKFYIKMDLPVDFATEVGGSENTRQLVLVGILSMTIGIVLAGVVFFPNGPRERIIVGVTSFSIFLVGLLLYRMGRKDDSGVADDACQPD